MNELGTPKWLGLAFPVVFVGAWFFVLNLLASMGGWRSLAMSYGTASAVDGKTFWFRSGRFGTVNYGSCLIFTASRSELRIAVMLPFRPGHHPLVVRWPDISATEHRGWVFRYVDFRFKQKPDVRLRLSRQLAVALIDAGGNAVRITES